MTTYTLTEEDRAQLLDAQNIGGEHRRQSAIALLKSLQPNTQWQDLTVLEQAEATSKFGHVLSTDMIGIADAIGVKLREKNGHSHQAHGVKP